MRKRINKMLFLILLGLILPCVLSCAPGTALMNQTWSSDNDTFTHVPKISTGAGIPPSINITYPLDKQTVMGIVNITAMGSCSIPVIKIELKIDGQSAKNTTTTSPLSVLTAWYLWNTTRYTDGYHNITAIVTDSIARKAQVSIMVNVQNTINSTLPTIIILGGLGACAVGLGLLNRKASLRGKRAGGSSRGSPGQDKEFNPQPEPPGKPGNYGEFNPQPEPPGKPGNYGEFNPQPEPPGKSEKLMKKKKQMKR